MELSGAEILIRSLSDHGIDTIFGYPGSCVMQILDNLYDEQQIRHILVRHEQGAVHAACGYSRSADRPGAALVTSGPGATNTVTGIADAFFSGIPLLVITGQVSSGLIGTDAFQEVDIISLTASVTKWNYQIREADQMAGAVAKALRIATSGRPGPVLLDITKDAQTGRAEYIPRIFPVNYSCSFDGNPDKPYMLSGNGLLAEVVRILEGSGKEMVLVVDKIPNGFYPQEYFCPGRVLRSGIFGVAGFGLPAAIGAASAVSDKTICLVAGAFEFQSTIEELGVLKQQGLNIKVILFDDSAGNGFRIENPDFIRLFGAYGIKGERTSANDDLPGRIRKMLDTAGSCLLEIRGGAI